MRTLCVIILCAYGAVAWAAPVRSPDDRDAARVARLFQDRVRAYVTLQKELEGSLAGMKAATEVERLKGHQDGLARSIAAARQASRRGDIFTPEVTALFRSVIREALEGRDGRRIRRTIMEGDPEKATVLAVNAVYPEEIPLGTMPPSILRRLPALPVELAYRFVGTSLVLKDVKTNVILDFMPEVMLRGR